jgi:hypothetical protein
MKSRRSQHPWITLLAAILVLTVFQGAYVVAGVSPSDLAITLSTCGLGLAFVLWVLADARQRQRVPCYDFGLLIIAYFPVSLLWYVFSSRGWRGMLTLAALLGLMLVPSLAATLVWLLKYGFR